jgi:hypothetical protein
MWSTEYTRETPLAPEAVWAALRDLHTGTKLSERSNAIEIHGPFAVGTEMSVTPEGQEDPLRSTIVELVDGAVYTDQTEFNGLILRNRHSLTPLANGGTLITHCLEIDGPAADDVGPELGPRISEDFPADMDDLVAAASRPERIAHTNN